MHLITYSHAVLETPTYPYSHSLTLKLFLPTSEQVILDLKGSDYSYSYQTPPASPSNTLSRKSSISR